MPPLVYQPTFVRGLSVVTWVLLAAAMVMTAIQDIGSALQWLPLVSFVAVAVYVMFWRPAVEVDDEAVTVRNLVRDIRIPWRRLDAIDTRYSLRLDAGDRRYAAWAAPAPGRATALRQSKKDALALQSLGTNLQHGLRSSATPNSDSGGAALMVQARWERVLGQPQQETGDPPPVTVQLARLPMLLLLVTAAATALSIALS